MHPAFKVFDKEVRTKVCAIDWKPYHEFLTEKNSQRGVPGLLDAPRTKINGSLCCPIGAAMHFQFGAQRRLCVDAHAFARSYVRRAGGDWETEGTIRLNFYTFIEGLDHGGITNLAEAVGCEDES